MSNRPDLVSGGDVRIAVGKVKGLKRKQVTIRLNGKDVTKQFAVRPGGRYEAVLTGLDVGRNVIKATGRRNNAGKKNAHSDSKIRFAGRLVVTNHPNGGPIFSGPQHGPYRCQETAVDEQCNEPASYSFLYKSSNPLEPGLKSYDPGNPPSDVATTTSDTGETVPFIVRREDGFQARDRYTVLALWQPGKKWDAFEQQPQFNHKVLIPHGGNCGASYSPGNPPLEDYAGTIPEFPGIEQSYITALGLGFAVVSTALNNTGHNCSIATEAESLLMAKEYFVEQYGTIRYTIGTGCSGGSIAQNTIANSYPGIYQGLLTTCTYPDVITAGAQFADYHLMRRYFEDPSLWAPGVVWLPTQVAAVEGHISMVNAIAADELLFKSALNPENDCSGSVDTVPGDTSTRYDSETNPGGVRCSVLDIMKNMIGVRPEASWGEQEKEIGEGFAGLPFANIGIQYGLEPLRRGEITTQQFVDLNVKLGGLDVDLENIAERTVGDIKSIGRAYRTGLINEGQHMDSVAIINFGGPDPGIAHDYAHAFWVEDRMRRSQGGTTPNRVMWFGVTPLIGDPRWANESLTAMDRWLTAVERDRSSAPLAQKVADNRPDDITDRCDNVPGVLEIPGADGDERECVLPDSLQLRLSTPREQAGDDVLNDRVACQLRPIARADYDFLLAPLSDAQWATLQEVFPFGVCDYTKPGRGFTDNETWLRYGNRSGEVVYGGRSLPTPGSKQAFGWQSRSFRPLLQQ
ncbi:DUF6351 family protein [Nocardioides sp.]|uniref:DUF6351 family protein n=1 Tax=Nocardioides sp. TaxID=35761 RepID=UPI002B273A9E|nr:DUF6351 family protein [Nocardioides sp.]